MTAVASGSVSLIPAATVAGVVTGSLYALFAISVVVLMRTAGIGNFAAGSMAMTFAFITYRTLIAGLGLPVLPASILGVVAGALIGIALYFVVFAPRSGFGAMNATFRSIGVYLLLVAVATQLWGANQPYSATGVASTRTIRVLGVNIGFDQVAVFAVAVIVLLLLYLLIQRTKTGLWMRSVGSNREAATLIGIQVRRVEVLSWAIAGALSALIGVLFAPITSLDTGMMDAFLINGFTAAIIGGIYSFPGGAIGGLLVGVAFSVTSIFVGPAYQDLIALGALLVVLRLRPQGLFGVSTRSERA